MGRLNKTGVRGLIRETVIDKATGEEVERWSIDLRYRDAEGHWQRFRERMPDGTKASAAKKRAYDVNNSATAGTLSTSTTTHKTVGDAFDAYVEWARTNRPSSYRSKRTQSRHLQRLLGRDTRLDDLSPFSLENFKKRRLEEVAAKAKGKGHTVDKYTGAASINRALAHFGHACKMFVSWKWMRAATAQAIRDAVERAKEPAGRVRCLTAEEEAKIMAKLPAGVRRIVRASTLSGLRRSECCNLRRDAVNLKAREITIAIQKNGKASHIPINDTLAGVLEEALAGNESAYVFLSERGQPYKPDTITSTFYAAAKAAGVRDVRFHDTRHTFATRLRRKGVGIDVLQDLGRWSDLTMVRRYAHVGDAEMRQAVAQLDEGSDRIAQHSTPAATTETKKTKALEVVR